MNVVVNNIIDNMVKETNGYDKSHKYISGFIGSLKADENGLWVVYIDWQNKLNKRYHDLPEDEDIPIYLDENGLEPYIFSEDSDSFKIYPDASSKELFKYLRHNMKILFELKKVDGKNYAVSVKSNDIINRYKFDYDYNEKLNEKINIIQEKPNYRNEIYGIKTRNDTTQDTIEHKLEQLLENRNITYEFNTIDNPTNIYEPAPMDLELKKLNIMNI